MILNSEIPVNFRRTLSLRMLNWIDALAALISGSFVLFFQDELILMFDLPENLLDLQISLSFVYALYSGYLLTKAQAPRFMYKFLIASNFLYSIFCAACLFYFYQQATVFGVTFLISEGVFVALLGFAELIALRQLPRVFEARPTI